MSHVGYNLGEISYRATLGYSWRKVLSSKRTMAPMFCFNINKRQSDEVSSYNSLSYDLKARITNGFKASNVWWSFLGWNRVSFILTSSLIKEYVLSYPLYKTWWSY